MTAQFQERFNLSSTTGKASLFISPVTVGDDKAYGEFRCELIDSLSKTWKRAILLEVIILVSLKVLLKLTVLLTVIQLFPLSLV